MLTMFWEVNVEQVPTPKAQGVNGRPLGQKNYFYHQLAAHVARKAELRHAVHSDPMVTSREVLEILSIGYSSLKKMLKEGRIKATRTSPRGNFRYKLSEVKRLMETEPQ
jgi:excisionase family DNA binding protein